MTRGRARISCAPSAPERAVQGTVSLLLLAFAIDSLPDVGMAAVVGAAGAALAVGAVRGWCPGSLAHRLAASAAARRAP